MHTKNMKEKLDFRFRFCLTDKIFCFWVLIQTAQRQTLVGDRSDTIVLLNIDLKPIRERCFNSKRLLGFMSQTVMVFKRLTQHTRSWRKTDKQTVEETPALELTDIL